MTTIDYIHREVMPTAFRLLPPRMETPAAKAMLLAIGLQESKFTFRVQVPSGIARGFYQFEAGGGVVGVLSHPSTVPLILPILDTLQYPATVTACYTAIAHNDVLACVFARLLLWTLPMALPKRLEAGNAWSQYMQAWRPGKPHRHTWDAYFAEAWDRVEDEPA